MIVALVSATIAAAELPLLPAPELDETSVVAGAAYDLKPATTVVEAPPREPEPEREPRLVVDFYPQAMTMALAAGGLAGGLVLHLPVSLTWAVGPSTALHAELAGAFVEGRGGGAGGSVTVSAGVSFSFGSSALQGFFICPKVGFQLSSAVLQLSQTKTTNGPIDLGPAWSRAFLGGADVGYQWTWEGRHIAVMIGASVGYEYDNDGPFVDAIGVQRGWTLRRTPPERNQGFAFAVNGNIFRVGFAL